MKNMPNKLHLTDAKAVCPLKCFRGKYKYYLQLHHMPQYNEKNQSLAFTIVCKVFNIFCKFFC